MKEQGVIQESSSSDLLDFVTIIADSEMLTNLEQIFTKLGNVNLRLNKKKCHFFKREIEYLGHIVSEKEILIDPKKN